MGLKHGKYIYVKRRDGWYIKVRVFNVRFGKKMEEGIDTSNPALYMPTGVKVKAPPVTAVVLDEDALPQPVREALYSV